MTPTLLAAAHGTRSAAGGSTTRRLAAMVQELRPALSVRLCYLDVLSPRLREVVDDLSGPVVVVPVLLSTGYHVLSDIPAVLADRAAFVATPPLGPDAVLTEVLMARLAAIGGLAADVVALVASGSSHPAAARDVATAAADLSVRLDRTVEPITIGPQLPTRLAALGIRGRTAVSTYLLAEGEFVDAVRRAAPMDVPVAAPLGADSAVARLILRRYDDAVGSETVR